MYEVTSLVVLQVLADAIKDELGRDNPKEVYAYTDPYQVGVYEVSIPEFNNGKFTVNLNVPIEERVTLCSRRDWPPTRTERNYAQSRYN